MWGDGWGLTPGNASLCLRQAAFQAAEICLDISKRRHGPIPTTTPIRFIFPLDMPAGSTIVPTLPA